LSRLPTATRRAFCRPVLGTMWIRTTQFVYRNNDLIEMFEGVEVLTIDTITPRFVEMKKAFRYGVVFEARRSGEVLRWTSDRGLTERIVSGDRPAWRNQDRHPHSIAIGPERNQRVIRIRGLNTDDERVDAVKLQKRELKRRERTCVKVVAWRSRRMST